MEAFYAYLGEWIVSLRFFFSFRLAKYLVKSDCTVYAAKRNPNWPALPAYVSVRVCCFFLFIFYVLYGPLFAATAFQSERFSKSERQRETAKDTKAKEIEQEIS